MADLQRASTAILLQQPFYGSLLMNYPVHEDEAIPTLCITPHDIRYNPNYFAQLSDAEGIAALLHEVIHGALDHLGIMQSWRDTGYGPDGKPFDMDKANIAADYTVNAMVVDTGMGALRSSWYYDPRRFPVSMLMEEIYCQLDDDETGGSGGQDGHEPGPADGSGPPPAITPDKLVSAAKYAKAVQGSVPSQFQRYIDEISKPKQSPWQQIRQFLVALTRGSDLSTYRRLQRRLITRGIGAPTRTGVRMGPLAIVVDTSGSIDEETLRFFAGHMVAILDELNPERVYLIWCDAQVHRVDEIRNVSDLKRVLAKGAPGGGGTDMCKGLDQAEELGVTATIVLTDLYSPTRESPIPTTWASTTSRVSPHGRTVHIHQ